MIIQEPVVQTIFPTTILLNNINRSFTKQELDFCEKYRQQTEQSYGGMGNYLTKDHRVLNNPELKELREFMEYHLEYYFRKIVCAKEESKLYITHSFLNYMRKSQGHSAHVHPNSYLSAVMYISADQRVDKISFSRSPRGDWPIRVDRTQDNPYNTYDCGMTIKTGDLVIFPSSIVHGVSPKEDDNLRISLVANTFLKGKIGNYEEYTDLYL